MNKTIQGALRRMVLSGGASSVARSLSTNRQTLTSYLAGIAQPGTVMLIESRYAEVFGEAREGMAHISTAIAEGLSTLSDRSGK
jgi:hypothetical protein